MRSYLGTSNINNIAPWVHGAHTFDSLEVKGIVKVLSDLPALGKKRENFAKSYLRDEFTLRKLPRDPSHFEGRTLWH